MGFNDKKITSASELNQLENRSSKQFTELENIENWASYGQKLIFSLNKFHFSTKTKKSLF